MFWELILDLMFFKLILYGDHGKSGTNKHAEIGWKYPLAIFYVAIDNGNL